MPKIMLVDDDIDLAELVKTKLVAEGIETHSINTGKGAFELAKQVKPDIAILDIMLPGETGYHICRRIRKDPELYKMGILILTALGEEPEILHGLEQGADDYLVKPFKLNRLMEKLASLNQLLDAITKRHPVSKLHGTDAMKREINHRLARSSPIATCYIDMVGFKPYCAVYGRDGQDKGIQHMAKMLVNLTRSMGVYECFVSHMGGEHFVVLLNLDDYERFCSTLMHTFDQSVGQLYSAKEVEQGYITATDKNGAQKKCKLMALSVGIAHTQYRQFKSAKKMFEVLAQVRQMARPEKQSVIFVDRRHTDR